MRLNSITLLLFALSPLLLTAADFRHNTISCEIRDDDHKKIQCTFVTERAAEDRNVIFFWHSASTPQDDRERTIVLKSGHASLYDYRYYYGRAQGEWEVSVKDGEENILATTTLTLP
jgi:hypothetical protein